MEVSKETILRIGTKKSDLITKVVSLMEVILIGGSTV